MATPPDFESLGLLEGLDSTAARRERIALLTQLHESGTSIDQLRAAVGEGRLALLPAERVLAGEPRYTSADIAQRSGLPAELLTAQRQASGLPVAAPGERAFSDEDLEAALSFKRFVDAGLPHEALLESTHTFGQAAARIAAATRTMAGLLRPGESERDVATRYADAAHELSGPTTETLRYLVRAHLLDQVRSDALSASQESSTETVAVGFADVVGFTQMGERMAPDDLSRIARRLAIATAEVAQPPTRLVKTIGDAVMLVARDPAPLLDSCLALLECGEGEGDDFPQLRIGVAFGDAVERFGDWYGPAANLASRVTSIARAGSLLATREAREATRERYSWSSAGRREVKGVAGKVALYRCRRVDPPQG